MGLGGLQVGSEGHRESGCHLPHAFVSPQNPPSAGNWTTALSPCTSACRPPCPVPALRYLPHMPGSPEPCPQAPGCLPFRCILDTWVTYS